MAETSEILVDNVWLTLRYNTTDRYLYHVCHQNVSGAPLHDMLNVGYNVAKERGIQKWLSDDRKNPELSQEDITFGVQDWGPRMAAIGWKYWALVVPETMAGRASMQQIIEVYFEMGVRVAIFSDTQQAHEWLVSR